VKIHPLLICLWLFACGRDATDAHLSKQRPLITLPTVVYIIVDGLRLDSFIAATAPAKGKTPDALAEVFGERLAKSRVVIDNHSVFPSVTFASNASLVTGVTVAEHGIAGNSYLDRKTGIPVDLASGRGMSNIFRKELADKVIRRDPMYAEFSRPSLVSFHFFGKGALWVKPESIDAVLYSKNPGAYDYLATGRLLGRLHFIEQMQSAGPRQNASPRQNAVPRVITLYWPGLDELTHRAGVSTQVGYVQGTLNANFNALLNGLVGANGGGLRDLGGGLGPYTFVLTADHGLSDARRRIISAEVSSVIEDALAALPEYRGLPPLQLSSTYYLAVNGAMMHIYLRMPNAPWSKRMSDNERGRQILETVGRALRDDPKLTDKLDLVFAALPNDEVASDYWKCIEKGGLPNADPSAAFDEAALMHRENSFRYFGAKESLTGLGPEGGDIILTSNYDAGYGFINSDTPTDGEFAAIHGSLFAEDMRVPLVIAGNGVPPGVVSAKGGNINPARIAATLAGSPLKGRPAPVFTPIKTSSPMWLSAPKRWAEIGTPYTATLAAISAAGRNLSYKLRQGPKGMSYDSASGTLRWVPGNPAEPVSQVIVDAVDSAGHKAELTYAIKVFPK
jgi:predicted AlkP superfamily pyrophosphatase or phosphodiesterase